MGIEDNIIAKAGKQNPFRVPDHYFEDFTHELMDKLPEQETMPSTLKITLWQRVKPWLYMAAMFCGIMLSVRIFVEKPNKEEFPITQTDAEKISNEEWELMMKQTFINDYALYEYLTEAND